MRGNRQMSTLRKLPIDKPKQAAKAIQAAKSSPSSMADRLYAK